MMIFLTPHVYYGDDNAVSPDDYFGKEVNRILDKYDFDKKEDDKEEKKKTEIRWRIFRRNKNKNEIRIDEKKKGKISSSVSDSVGVSDTTSSFRIKTASDTVLSAGINVAPDSTATEPG